VAVSRKTAPRRRQRTGRGIRDRLNEAEATLEAIRAGEVDALVVTGPGGERTVTIEGATHPYVVLLNAMNDGAALVEPGGAILFGNRSFADMAGAPLETLRGSMFQTLLAQGERARFEECLREAARQNVAQDFALVTGKRPSMPVAIALSMLPIEAHPRATRDGPEARGGAAVLMAIVTNLTYRKAAETTRARLLERLISAEDDERHRVSRELHDETGQSLAALLIGLRTIADMPVRPEVRRIALRLRDVAAHTVDDIGRLARGLHPAVLDDKGLAAAARRYVADYIRSFGTALDFVAEELDSPRLPPLAAATMYRILQEALTNVARHARCGQIVVELKRDQVALELLVRDDGVGFELSRTNDGGSGLGLRGMRERVTLLGGSIQIESKPGQGTAVHARIPTGSTGRSSTAGRKRVRRESPS
jgi:signal transduction histidine kinase